MRFDDALSAFRMMRFLCVLQSMSNVIGFVKKGGQIALQHSPFLPRAFFFDRSPSAYFFW